MNTDFFLLFLYADETYSVRLRRFFDSPVPPLAKRIVLKSSRPSLPLKKAPPLISVFFNGLYTPFGSPVCGGQKPQGRRGKPPYSVLEPLRYKVGGPKRSRQVMRDGTARGGKAICKYLNFLIWIEVLKETGSSLL